MSFVTVGCIEDIDTSRPAGEKGDDVQFGLSLDGLTRTVYGQEINNVFPIYWVNGDKVWVASPQCLDGRNNAKYEVSVSGAAQNYADKLAKTGDVGVQWGDVDATFYSVYPAENASLTMQNGSVVANMNISAAQNLNYTLVNNVYYAAAMDNVVMYAVTEPVSRGSVVNLKYKPLSTIIEFELNVGDQATGSIFIESITLEANTGIAGNFTFDYTFAEEKVNGIERYYPVVTPVTSATSKTITLNFTTQPELDANNPILKAKMCLMPISGVTTLDGWKVSVVVRNGADNTKTTHQKTIATAVNTSTALVPGLVHKIQLPILPTGDAWEYKPGNWMPQIPNYRNIYLTELSIPGAWYAGAPVSDGYQDTEEISELWKAGVRAFAVETRTATQSRSSYTNPVAVVVSGTGYSSTLTPQVGLNSLETKNKEFKYGYDNEAKSIQIEHTAGSWGGPDATRLSTIIKNVASAITDTEFAVLIISYADGGDAAHRFVDYGAWLNLLNSELDTFLNDDTVASSIKERIYTKPITAETIVDDVLGKLILKINIDQNIAKEGYIINRERSGGSLLNPTYTYTIGKSYVYNDNLPALFSYNPFLFQVGNTYFETPIFSKLHWSEWSDETTYRTFDDTPSSSNFLWCFNSANRTHTDQAGTYDIPTYQQRKNALGAMMEHSKSITLNSKHNVWFYFNVGGVQANQQGGSSTVDGATLFAGEMNPWLLEVINNKTNGYTDDKGVLHPSEPSPLGIVMFNQCTNSEYDGPEIIQAIIEMNNKFKLQYATQVQPTGAYVSVGGTAF